MKKLNQKYFRAWRGMLLDSATRAKFAESALDSAWFGELESRG